jgi:hypothetical protein
MLAACARVCQIYFAASQAGSGITRWLRSIDGNMWCCQSSWSFTRLACNHGTAVCSCPSTPDTCYQMNHRSSPERPCDQPHKIINQVLSVKTVRGGEMILLMARQMRESNLRLSAKRYWRYTTCRKQRWKTDFNWECSNGNAKGFW